MNLDIRDNRNFWTGLMFVAIGCGAIIVASRYPVGSTLHMGPGYLPMFLAGILIFFGILIILKGVFLKKESIGGNSPKSWRALCIIPLSLALFSLLIERAGFIPAVIVLCFSSAIAGRQFNWREVLLLTLLLLVLSVGLFIWGLELPYPLIKGYV